MEPSTAQEFMDQCKEGCRRQRELLDILLAPRINSNHSPQEKLEIARTCLASQLEYYRNDPDYPVDDFIALHQLSQLLIYSDSWDHLKNGLCIEGEL